MFVDYRNWRPPEPIPEEPARPQLTRQQEKHLIWAVGLCLLAMFCGPLAGVTMFDAVLAVVAGN